MCFHALWKTEPVCVSDEFGYFAEEMSKQSVEGTAWSLLAAYSNTQEERDKLKSKCEAKRNKHSMIWKILSVSRECVFWKQGQVCDWTTFRKRLGVWLMDPINHLRRSQESRSIYPGNVCKWPLFCWLGLPRITCETKKDFEKFIQAEKLSTWIQRRQRWDVIKEEWLCTQSQRCRGQQDCHCHQESSQHRPRTSQSSPPVFWKAEPSLRSGATSQRVEPLLRRWADHPFGPTEESISQS